MLIRERHAAFKMFLMGLASEVHTRRTMNTCHTTQQRRSSLIVQQDALIADPDVMHFLKPEPGTVCLFIECAYTPCSPICRAPY